jgi:hypothetical protein
LVRIDPGNQHYNPGWPDHPQSQESLIVWSNQFDHRCAVQLPDHNQWHDGRIVKDIGRYRVIHFGFRNDKNELKLPQEEKDISTRHA